MTIGNAAKAGFGVGLGFAGLTIFGIISFVLGFVIVLQQNKKEKKNTVMLSIGFVFMIIGVALGLGFGGGELLNQIAGAVGN
jgi:glucose uptake protein GlcU